MSDFQESPEISGYTESSNSSYGKGNDARIVIRLRCSSMISLDINPLTIYETGFVTVTQKLRLFSWFVPASRSPCVSPAYAKPLRRRQGTQA
jgi:hypothetical protein